MAISSTRASARALLHSRGSSLLWRSASSSLHGGLGMAEEDSLESPSFYGGRSNRAGASCPRRRLEGIHSDASALPTATRRLSSVQDQQDLQFSRLFSTLETTLYCGSIRLSTYTEVPSNTKVSLFRQYVTTSPSLNRYARQALAQFASQDPGRGCSLGLAVHMVKTLTDSIRQHDTNRARCFENFVNELRFLDGKWHLESGEIVDQVYLAIGSAPSKYTSETGVQDIDVDFSLKPSKLREIVSKSDFIVVVGSSHSAMLALRNLVDCEVRPKKIINFYRSPLLYAQYMDNWILHDNTGLKGEVADWAKKEIDTGNLEAKGIVTRICVKGRSLDEQRELWRGCTKLIQAVGFSRNALPKLSSTEKSS